MPEKKKMSEKSDKRLRARVNIGNDKNGKPIYKKVSGKTKKELEEKKKEMLRSYVGGGETCVDRSATFGTYASKWYEAYKKPDLSLSSRLSYGRLLNNHLLQAFAERQLRAITAIELQDFVNSKSHMCKSDIGYIHSILTNVFQKAYAQGILDRDPTVGLIRPSKEQESRRELTEAETAASLKVAADHPQGIIIYLLYYTGMRIGEVLGLQWQDIDFKEKFIHVRRDLDFKARDVGEVKTKNSLREIPLAFELEAILLPLRGVGSTFVIQAPKGGHYNNSSFYRVWGELSRAIYLADPSIEAGEYSIGKDAKGKPLTEARSILTPHYFRHNFATGLYDAEVDLVSSKRILGHASAKTTLDIYTHLSNKQEHVNANKARMVFAKK